jgi:hypothetical protein
MAPTIAAILARFNGDRRAAIDYCIDVARNPRLADEYRHIMRLLRQKRLDK